MPSILLIKSTTNGCVLIALRTFCQLMLALLIVLGIPIAKINLKRNAVAAEDIHILLKKYPHAHGVTKFVI